MSDKFFGELLKQYEMLEAATPTPTTAPRSTQRPNSQRRQEREAERRSSAPAQPQSQKPEPGFFGRMGQYIGGEWNRSMGRSVPALDYKTLRDREAKIKDLNTKNRAKYADSNQYIQDTSSLYEKQKQEALKQATKRYDDMIKKNNEKLAQRMQQPNAAAPPAAPKPQTPAPVAKPQAQVPVARPQVPMAASVAPQIPAPAPVARPQAPTPTPTPYIRPQVNAAAQQVDRLRAEARARNAATAPPLRR